jgi:hypothetical protein
LFSGQHGFVIQNGHKPPLQEAVAGSQRSDTEQSAQFSCDRVAESTVCRLRKIARD